MVQKHYFFCILVKYLIIYSYLFSVTCPIVKRWKLSWITWHRVNLDEPVRFLIAHHLGKLFTTGKTAMEQTVLFACLLSKTTWTPGKINLMHIIGNQNFGNNITSFQSTKLLFILKSILYTLEQILSKWLKWSLQRKKKSWR